MSLFEKVADTLEEAKKITTGKTLREVKVEAHVDPADCHAITGRSRDTWRHTE